MVGKDESETARPEDYVYKDEEEAEEDPTSPSYGIRPYFLSPDHWLMAPADGGFPPPFFL